MYKDKIELLKSQLDQLKQGTLPEYKRGLQRLEIEYNDRLMFNSMCKKLEIDRLNRDYSNDFANAQREFDERKAEIKESLIAELDEKKRQIEHEYQQTDLAGDFTDVKPMTTRKLRNRRALDLPPSEKRQKSSPIMALRLRESEINEDLTALNIPLKLSSSNQPRNGIDSLSSAIEEVSSFASLNSSPSSSYARKLSPRYFSPDFDPAPRGKGYQSPSNRASASSRGGGETVYVENGRLWYESRWFGRGAAVQVESEEHGSVAGVIQSISGREIRVKKTRDETKIRITLPCLLSGKILMKKRNPTVSAGKH